MINFLAKLIGRLPYEEEIKEFSEKDQKTKTKILLNKRADLFTKYNIEIAVNEIYCGLVGIEKMKNFTHINSVLQCLVNTIPLTQELITNNSWMKNVNPFSKDSQGEIICLYYLMLKEIWGGKNCVVCPEILYKKLLKIKDIYSSMTKKNDIKIFLKNFLYILSEDLNETIVKKTHNRKIKINERFENKIVKSWNFFCEQNNSLITRLFYGQYIISHKCFKCRVEKNIIKHYNFITLHLPRVQQVQFEGYIMDIFNRRKIVKFLFSTNLYDDIVSNVFHVIEEKKLNKKNYESFFYRKNEMVDKIGLDQGKKVEDIINSKNIFFLVETKNEFISQKFNFEYNQENIYLSFFLMYNQEVINIEQLLKFKNKFTIHELYKLILFVFMNLLKKFIDKKYKKIFKGDYCKHKKVIKSEEIVNDVASKNEQENKINSDNKFDNNDFFENLENNSISIFENLFLKNFKESYPFYVEINKEEKVDFDEEVETKENLNVYIKINKDFFHCKKNIKKSVFFKIADRPITDITISLNDLIKYNFLNRKDHEKCQNCHHHFHTSSLITYFPKILIFYIDRYHLAEKYGNFYKKIDRLVNFPIRSLNLDDFSYFHKNEKLIESKIPKKVKFNLDPNFIQDAKNIKSENSNTSLTKKENSIEENEIQISKIDDKEKTTEEISDNLNFTPIKKIKNEDHLFNSEYIPSKNDQNNIDDQKETNIIKSDLKKNHSPCKEKEKKKNYDYRLYSVCNKFGSNNNSHFNSFCLNNLKKEWFSFDSDIIKQLNKDSIVTKEATLLFYSRK